MVHEFTKENDVTINRTNTFSNDFSGSTGKYGLGLDAQITPQAAFYTEINYLNGNKRETPVSANLGFGYVSDHTTLSKTPGNFTGVLRR